MGWRKFCTNFNHKTPTSFLWKLVKVFKHKNLQSSSFNQDDFLASQAEATAKICPPSCAPDFTFSLDSFLLEDLVNINILNWLDAPITYNELVIAIKSAKLNSSPGLDLISYKIIARLPVLLLKFLLDIYNEFLNKGIFPLPWRQSLVLFLPNLPIYFRFRWWIESTYIIPDKQGLDRLNPVAIIC